jgi:hypothetical protein
MNALKIARKIQTNLRRVGNVSTIEAGGRCDPHPRCGWRRQTFRPQGPECEKRRRSARLSIPELSPAERKRCFAKSPSSRWPHNDATTRLSDLSSIVLVVLKLVKAD